MPKLVDYVARYALLQETVFQVVLTQGVHALSRRSIARLLEMSPSTVHRLVNRDADLVMIATDEVDVRRRRALALAPRGEQSRDRALRSILDLVPGTPRRSEDELVWLRLTLSAGPSEELAQRLAESRTSLTGALTAVVQLLDVPAAQRDVAIEDLQIMIEGLTWAVCTGRVAPEETTPVIERTIDRWSPGSPQTAAARTTITSGRSATTCSQVSPESAEPQTLPLRAPK